VVLGLAREQVESAMAHALGDVAELVTYDAHELAAIKPATPAPLTDEAHEKENHRLKAIAYARRYLLKLLNIELEVPCADWEAERNMLKHGQAAAEPSSYSRTIVRLALAACAILLAGGVALRLSGPAGAADTGEVVQARTNAPSPVVKNEEANAPAPTSAANVFAWTGPSREGAKPAPLAARRQWLWPGLFGAAFALAVVAVLRQRRERQAKDSPDFLKALDVHWEEIRTLFPTPREKKRFINRVRYLAMRREETGIQKSYWELLRDWFRPGGKGEESNLVDQRQEAATAAAHTIALMLQKTVKARDQESTAAVSRLEARHVAAFGSRPTPEQRTEFERLSAEIQTY